MILPCLLYCTVHRGNTAMSQLPRSGLFSPSGDRLHPHWTPRPCFSFLRKWLWWTELSPREKCFKQVQVHGSPFYDRVNGGRDGSSESGELGVGVHYSLGLGSHLFFSLFLLCKVSFPLDFRDSFDCNGMEIRFKLAYWEKIIYWLICKRLKPTLEGCHQDLASPFHTSILYVGILPFSTE